MQDWFFTASQAMTSMYRGGTLAVAYLALAVGANETHEAAMQHHADVGQRARDRKVKHDERSATDRESEARSRAESAEYIQQRAETERAIRLKDQENKAKLDSIAARTQADVTVMQKKAEGEIRLVQTKGVQQVQRAQENTQYRLREQETEHKTSRIGNLQAHLDQMTQLNRELASSSDATALSAETNEESSHMTQQSITKLNLALNKALAAQQKLEKSLMEFDQTILQGELSAEKEAALHAALLESIQAEARIEKFIAISEVTHDSKLKQAFMQDVAQKHEEIDNLLATCSGATRKKLTELIELSIHQLNEKSTHLTDPDQIEECKQQLAALDEMRTKVKHLYVVREEEPESQPKNQL